MEYSGRGPPVEAPDHLYADVTLVWTVGGAHHHCSPREITFHMYTRYAVITVSSTIAAVTASDVVENVSVELNALMPNAMDWALRVDGVDPEAVELEAVEFDVADSYLWVLNCVEYNHVESDVVKLDVAKRDVSELVEIDTVNLAAVVSDV